NEQLQHPPESPQVHVWMAPGLARVVRGVRGHHDVRGWLGNDSIAAYQQAINVNAFVFMLALGLQTATCVRVAVAVGRNDRYASGWLGPRRSQYCAAGRRRRHHLV